MGPLSAVVAATLCGLAIWAYPGRGAGSAESRATRSVLPPREGVSHRRRVTDVLDGWLPWRTQSRRAAQEGELLALVEGLGAGLAAGLTPADALTTAVGLRGGGAGLPPAVERALPSLERCARTGEGLGTAWAEVARRSGSRELLLLARAWSLSERSGASLAAAATTTARLVRADRDRRAQAATAVAGARTTMAILTLLPLGGPFLAAAMGLDLGRLYGSSPIVWAALAAGVVLVLVGRWWVARLVASALSGPVLR